MVYLYIPVRTPESFGTGVFFMLKNKSKQTKKALQKPGGLLCKIRSDSMMNCWREQ